MQIECCKKFRHFSFYLKKCVKFTDMENNQDVYILYRSTDIWTDTKWSYPASLGFAGNVPNIWE